MDKQRRASSHTNEVMNQAIRDDHQALNRTGRETKQSGRILTPHDLEIHEFRSALIAHYRNEKRYKYIVNQVLQPRWRAMKADPFSTFGQCEAATGYDEADPCATTYVEAVYKALTGLRLVKSGEPAEWAADFLHADVIAGQYGPFDPSIALWASIDAVALKIEVTPSGAWLRLVEEYTSLGEGGSQNYGTHELASRRVESDDAFAFDKWDQLEDVAQVLVHEWLAGVRQSWSKRYPHRNAATLPDKREDIALLFRHIHHREPVDSVLRRRLERVADPIGIDLPTSRKNTPEKHP